jgi:hypothetical protein
MNIRDAADYTPDARGMFAGIPMQGYQLIPALSASGLLTLSRSPLDYLRQRSGELIREPSDAMELGTVYHALTFENRRDYYTRPDTYMGPESAKKDAQMIAKKWNANATACSAWLEEHSDLPVYSSERSAEIEAGVNYIQRHPLAGPILAQSGMCEVSIFSRAETFGFPIKGRPDKIWFDSGKVFVADLKTINDATTHSCSKTILARRYHVQAAMYRYIIQRLGFEHGGHSLIFFEEGASPKCNVRQLATQAIDHGESELNDGFDLYNRCRVHSDWPEWTDCEAGVGFIDLPDFVYGDVEISAS